MSTAHKRKREQLDHGPSNVHPSHGPDFSHYLNHAGDGDIDLAHALKQHNSGGGAQHGQDPLDHSEEQHATDTANAALHFGIPEHGPTDPSFLEDAPGEQPEPSRTPNFDLESPDPPATASAYPIEPLKDAAAPIPAAADPLERSSHSPPANATSSEKPPLGSKEWQAGRRNAHKEVERRRRETINEGINELARIVPGSERNKGSVLHRTVLFIAELQDRIKQMEDKNNLEKMVFEQAIAEMSSTGDHLKEEVRRLEREVERYRDQPGVNEQR